MSHKRYTQYSKFSGDEPEIEESESAIIEQPLEGQTTIPEVEPEVVAEPEPELESENRKFGKVTGCKKLNVRKLPSRDAEIVSELVEGSEIMIDDQNSTALFYKICTEHGIEGYCVKNFIKVLL